VDAVTDERLVDDVTPAPPDREWLEVVATLLLALAAVATAWASYQATRWNGEQTKASSRTTALRIQASSASALAESQTQIDVATFIQWVDAKARGEVALQQFYVARFRPEFVPAFDAWLASDPLTDPTAPPTPFAMKEYAPAARAEADELERRLSHLRIVVEGGSTSSEVLLDGQRLGASALDTQLPVDPGPHGIEARGAGKQPWTASVLVASGPSEQVLHVPRLADDASAAEPTTPPGAPPASQGPSARKIAAFTALGVGAIGIAVGTVFGVRTFAREDEADAICAGRACKTQKGIDLHDQASDYAEVSTIAFGVGLGAAALGVGLLVLPTDRAGTRSARGAMIGWRGRW
jgi:hypothetical protein